MGGRVEGTFRAVMIVMNRGVPWFSLLEMYRERRRREERREVVTWVIEL